jgi:hypothetical protein
MGRNCAQSRTKLSVGGIYAHHCESLRLSNGHLTSAHIIAFVKAVNASGGVNQLLLAGKKRVALRANFHLQVGFAGRAGLKRMAASAMDIDFDVIGMYFSFHSFSPLALG